jgi:hypothetical protein
VKLFIAQITDSFTEDETICITAHKKNLVQIDTANKPVCHFMEDSFPSCITPPTLQKAEGKHLKGRRTCGAQPKHLHGTFKAVDVAYTPTSKVVPVNADLQG